MITWYKTTVIKDDLYKIGHIKDEFRKIFEMNNFDAEKFAYVAIFGSDDKTIESQNASTFYFTSPCIDYYPILPSILELTTCEVPSASDVELKLGGNAAKGLLAP